MKRLWLASVLLLSPSTSAAMGSAAMGWGDTHDLNLQDLYMDCGAPIEATLVASFPAPTGIEKLYRLEGHIDFCTYGSVLPEWWRFDVVGGCREGDLTVSADFANGPFTHDDYWQGNGTAQVEFILQNPTRARIQVSVDIDSTLAGPLIAGAEYYAFKVSFSPPDGACYGCPFGACFMLNDEITLTHSLGKTSIYSDNFESYARWQSGDGSCPFIVSVESSTWGQLKSGYRSPAK